MNITDVDGWKGLNNSVATDILISSFNDVFPMKLKKGLALNNIACRTT